MAQAQVCEVYHEPASDGNNPGDRSSPGRPLPFLRSWVAKSSAVLWGQRYPRYVGEPSRRRTALVRLVWAGVNEGDAVVGDGGLEPPTSPIHRGTLTKRVSDQSLQIHTAFHRLQLILSPARGCLVFELFRIHEHPWPCVSGRLNFTVIVLSQSMSWVSRKADIVTAVPIATQDIDRIAQALL